MQRGDRHLWGGNGGCCRESSEYLTLFSFPFLPLALARL